MLNGKMQNLAITKYYLSSEYKDLFEGIGTLPGGPYHIQLKKYHDAVKHTPRKLCGRLS